MKILLPAQSPFRSRAQSRGSAVLVVLVVLALVALLASENSRALRQLEQTLKHINQRQLQKYGPGFHPTPTNSLSAGSVASSMATLH